MTKVRILNIASDEFKTFLQKELNSRLEKNQAYSLRAFAKSMEIDASYLSKVLNGKKELSEKVVSKLADRLNLPVQEKQKYLANFKLDDRINTYKEIAIDRFQVISNWKHYAILELITANNFTQDVSWMAKILESTEEEISECIQRLIVTKFIKEDENGKWIMLEETDTSHILDLNITSYAHKIYQKALLEQAKNAIDNTEIEQREQSSMMFTSNPQKIVQAKVMIQDFRRELTKFMENTDDKNTVYHLSTSLFPIAQTKEELK